MASLTLDDLGRASRRGLLNISKLSRLLGMDRRTLRARIKRGSPPLTAEEQDQIQRVLGHDGIRLVPDMNEKDAPGNRQA